MKFKVTASKRDQYGFKVVKNTIMESPTAYQVCELLKLQGFTDNHIEEIK